VCGTIRDCLGLPASLAAWAEVGHALTIVSPSFSVAGFAYLFWVIVMVPLMGIWSWYRIRSGKPLAPKEKRYRAMILTQVWLVVITFAVMQENGVDCFARGWPPLWGWALATGYMALLTQRVRVGWRKISEERKQNARRLLPESYAHLRYWIPISLLAGFSEEFAFRGVAFVLLTRLLHSEIVAVCLCVISFALGHMMQGWRGVLGTSIIAVLMHGLVYLTGGLYLPIVTHAAFDLIVGCIAVRSFTQASASTLQQAQAAS
jgi:membrane protease YdiL (CAAX protease family)